MTDKSKQIKICSWFWNMAPRILRGCRLQGLRSFLISNLVIEMAGDKLIGIELGHGKLFLRGYIYIYSINNTHIIYIYMYIYRTCFSLRTENRSRKTHVFEYRDCGVGWGGVGGHVNVPCTSYMIYCHAAKISGIIYYVTCCYAAEISGIVYYVTYMLPRC